MTLHEPYDQVADFRGLTIDRVETVSESDRSLPGEAVKVLLSLSGQIVGDLTVYEQLLDDVIEGGRDLTLSLDGILVSLWYEAR